MTTRTMFYGFRHSAQQLQREVGVGRKDGIAGHVEVAARLLASIHYADDLGQYYTYSLGNC